jgi:RNA polymerase sigma-70 factor, ECF subfamily
MGDGSSTGNLQKAGFQEEALPHLDAVYRFALRLAAGDADLAEDVAQDTFVRAYKSWHTYTRGTNCRSWLFTICRTTFLQHRQRAARRGVSASDAFPDADVGEVGGTEAIATGPPKRPDEALFEKIDPLVTRAIDALPDVFREALVASDLHGFSYEEISELLDIPIGTVRSRLDRGRRMLQEQLRDYAVEMGYIDQD